MVVVVVVGGGAMGRRGRGAGIAAWIAWWVGGRMDGQLRGGIEEAVRMVFRPREGFLSVRNGVGLEEEK